MQLSATPVQFCWLSLDAEDNDLYRFWRYLIAALQTVNPSVGIDLMEQRASSPPPPIPQLLVMLINDMESSTTNALPISMSRAGRLRLARGRLHAAGLYRQNLEEIDQRGAWGIPHAITSGCALLARIHLAQGNARYRRKAGGSG
ncbi:MAG TPA: hypothetical protein VLH85_06640, partial [Levilinea sp.]|nr:hypothetical protein [Levilinea sp.]